MMNNQEPQSKNDKRGAVSSTDLLGLLHADGYKTVEGRDAVLAAIAAESDGSSEALCSGYRVFPDGTKCNGCRDCKPSLSEEFINDVQFAIDQHDGALPWWDQKKRNLSNEL